MQKEEKTIQARIIDATQPQVAISAVLSAFQLKAHKSTLKANLERTFPWGSYDLRGKKVVYGVIRKDEDGDPVEATIYRQGYIMDDAVYEKEYIQKGYEVWILGKR